MNGPTTTLFIFNADLTYDVEDDFGKLEFRWDWENDGSWDTDFTSFPSSDHTITHQFISSGTKTVKMEVRDPLGLTDTYDVAGIEVTGPDNDPSLIGTWNLVSVNGEALAPGVFLRWTFTATTVTVTSDMDCVEVLAYSSEGGILRGLDVISREGTECEEDDDDETVLGPYSVVGGILTVTMTDPEMEPPTAVFVFTKSP
jgi:hypothetical protein